MPGLIVHEWVEKSGGSEKVVEELLAEFPQADLQVLWSDAPDRFARPVRETWLARTALRKRKELALPLMPLVWRGLDRRPEPEWMLVSSHLFAHHARLRNARQIPKLVYAHTPARYIWEPSLDARGASAPVRIASAVLKPIDRSRAQEAISIAANSEFTRQRVRRAWNRDATVIFPPVDTRRIRSERIWQDRLSPEEEGIVLGLPETFVLGASRFVSYKRLDLVIRCGEANDLPVVLAGAGPDEARLRAIATDAAVPVIFVDRPSDPLLFTLYQRSLVLVFPAIEDFGIMPVEAMAAGTPVIVPSVGGAAESVALLHGGTTFERDDLAEWRNSLHGALEVDRHQLADRAEVLSNESFRSRIRHWFDLSLTNA